MDTANPDLTAPDARTRADLATAVASGESLRNFRRYTYWSQVGASVGLLLFFKLVGPAPLPPDPLGIVSLLGVLVVAVAVVRLTDHHIPPAAETRWVSPREWRAWAVTGSLASLVVAAMWAVAGNDALWAYAPALMASLLIASLPQRARRIAVVLTIGAAAGVGIVIGIARGDDPLVIFPLGGAVVTGFLLALTLATLWTWRVAVQLDEARRAAATLAVTTERLRFAAELHDIQGHHLQVIALKSELASRLVRTDPDAAEQEIDAVQRLAADALRDTRAVVQGYRRTTLDAEIANATTVLGSAGIDARLHLDPPLDGRELPENGRHLLGLVVREAITNVLRHSTARRADVTLTRDDFVRLTISNDGVTNDAASKGGGLHDLAERLRAAGGAMSWQRTGERFEVHAQLPNTSSGAEADSEARA